jgi:hypothetical protein
MAAFVFTRTCLALAKMYADVLVVNRRDVRPHFPTSDIRKPLVDLLFLGRALEDDSLSDSLRWVWAEVIANEMIEKAAKEYNRNYHIDITELRLPDRHDVVNYSQNFGQRALSH